MEVFVYILLFSKTVFPVGNAMIRSHFSHPGSENQG